MRHANRISVAALFMLIGLLRLSLAQEPSSFRGQVNSNNINIRSDSTINSEIVSKLNKNDYVEVALGLYNWYKIKLPKTAPAFIRKDLLGMINNKTARVLKDRVNILLKPEESSAILGRIKKNEILTVLEEKSGWYRIEPPENSFGWVHKQFIDRADEPAPEPPAVEKNADARTYQEETIVVEGVIRPKIIKRIATHKLITATGRVVLLKGNTPMLEALNHRKVKIAGRLINPQAKGAAVIEITEIEAQD